MIDYNDLSSEDYERARLAVEDVLIGLRDMRVSIMRNNGLCVKEYNGTRSDVIRMSIEDALRIGMKAIIKGRE